MYDTLLNSCKKLRNDIGDRKWHAIMDTIKRHQNSLMWLCHKIQ